MDWAERLLRIRGTRRILIFLIIFYVVIAAIVIYPTTFAFLKENVVLITGLMALLAVVIALQGTMSDRTKRRIDLDDYERLVKEETHPVFYTRITKDVKILDENGSAETVYKMTCRNTGEGRIPQLIHEIKHDGSLEQCLATVNDKVADATFSKFVINKVDGDPSVPLSHILKIKYNLTDANIEVGDTFTYGYDLRYKNVFPDMFKLLEEYTAHHVLYPTGLLILRLSAPKGCKFARGDDRIDLKIRDKNEVRVDREELRCKKLFSPQFFNADTEVMLEIMSPKIACTYALHFTMVKR